MNRIQKSFLACSIILSLICLCISTFAQEERFSNLGDVTLRFCNDTTVTGGTKSLILDTETEENTEICILLNNNGPTDIKVSLNFVDGTVTADSDQKKACEPEEQKTNFGQYVTAVDTGLFLQAGQTLQTKATVKFPAGYAGTSYGCITYQVLQETGTGAQSNVGMFNIVSRRANFIDVHVKGEVSMQLVPLEQTNESLEPINKDKYLTLYKNLIENKEKIRFELYNTGNIGVETSLGGFMCPWRSKFMVYKGVQYGCVQLTQPDEYIEKILPKQSKSFEYAVPHRIQRIGGPTNFWFNYNYSPIIIGKNNFEQSATKTETISSTHIFVPWSLLLMSIIIGWYIGSTTRRRKQKKQEVSSIKKRKNYKVNEK